MAFKMYNFSFADDLPIKVEIDKSGIDIAEMFDYLESEHGSKIKQKAIADGKFTQRTRVTINGHQIDSIHEMIPDGSEVLVSFMLPGG